MAFGVTSCTTPAGDRSLPMERYDRDTRYSIQDKNNGFDITVIYSRYQFVPEQASLLSLCQQSLTAIAYEYAAEKDIEVEPINLQKIRMSVGRNGITGVTTCQASAAVGVASIFESDGREPQNEEPELTSTGTGFFISETLIATNHHVIDNASKVQIISGGESYKATLLLFDASLDLAILEAEPATAVDERLCFSLDATTDLTPGKEIFAAGFPLSEILSSDAKITSGIISSRNGIGDDPKTFQLTAPLQPGNSGGPIFSANGLLAGVAVATLSRQNQNVNFAIKPIFLSALLASSGSAIECTAPLHTERDPIENFHRTVALIAKFD